jgi:hypothetical protein
VPSCTSYNAQKWGAWPPARQWVQCCHELSIEEFCSISGAHIFRKKMFRLTLNHLCNIIYIQWNLDSSFPLGDLKKNDGYGKTIDAGAYIKWIETVTFAHMYLLNQKTYTSDIISTVKISLHYLFLKRSLIHICLVAPFFFRLNNNLSILTTFVWSLTVMSWPYMNALTDWNNTQANKKQ